jgi:hypothetical protein
VGLWSASILVSGTSWALSGGPSAVFLTMNIIGSWHDQMVNRKPELASSGGPSAVFLLPCISLDLGVTK